MGQQHRNDDIYIDANGYLKERVMLGGQEVMIRYDDIPESDVTTVDGIRCTTPLRTLVDIAPDVDAEVFQQMVRHCLEREMFTVAEAMERISQPDVRDRLGARLLRRELSG
jgi:hypothetical protein